MADHYEVERKFREEAMSRMGSSASEDAAFMKQVDAEAMKIKELLFRMGLTKQL